MRKQDIKIGLEVWAYNWEHPYGLHTQVISKVRTHDELGEVVTCAMIGDPVPIKYLLEQQLMPTDNTIKELYENTQTVEMRRRRERDGFNKTMLETLYKDRFFTPKKFDDE